MAIGFNIPRIFPSQSSGERRPLLPAPVQHAHARSTGFATHGEAGPSDTGASSGPVQRRQPSSAPPQTLDTLMHEYGTPQFKPSQLGLMARRAGASATRVLATAGFGLGKAVATAYITGKVLPLITGTSQSAHMLASAAADSLCASASGAARRLAARRHMQKEHDLEAATAPPPPPDASTAVGYVLATQLSSTVGGMIDGLADALKDASMQYKDCYTHVYDRLRAQSRAFEAAHPEHKASFEKLDEEIRAQLATMKEPTARELKDLRNLLEARELLARIPYDTVNVSHWERGGDIRKRQESADTVERIVSEAPKNAQDGVRAFMQDMVLGTLPIDLEGRSTSVICLAGAPGTGKSHAATQIFEQLGKKPVRCTMEDLIEISTGRRKDGSPRVTPGSTPAECLGPFYEWIRSGDLSCPIIIDEVDFVGPQGSNHVDDFKRILDPEHHELKIDYPAVPGVSFRLNLKRMAICFTTNQFTTEDAITRRVPHVSYDTASEIVRRVVADKAFDTQVKNLEKFDLSDAQRQAVAENVRGLMEYIIRNNIENDPGVANLKPVIAEVFIFEAKKFLEKPGGGGKGKQAAIEQAPPRWADVPEDDIPEATRKFIDSAFKKRRDNPGDERLVETLLLESEESGEHYSLKDLTGIVESRGKDLGKRERAQVVFKVLCHQSRGYEASLRERYERVLAQYDGNTEARAVVEARMPIESIQNLDAHIARKMQHLDSDNVNAHDTVMKALNVREMLCRVPFATTNISHRERGGDAAQRARMDKIQARILRSQEEKIREPIKSFLNSMRDATLAFDQPGQQRPAIILAGQPGVGKAALARRMFDDFGKPYISMTLDRLLKLTDTAQGSSYAVVNSAEELLGELMFFIESGDAGCGILVDKADFGDASKKKSSLQRLFDPEVTKLIVPFPDVKGVNFVFDISRSPLCITTDKPVTDSDLLMLVSQVEIESTPENVRRQVAAKIFDDQARLLGNYDLSDEDREQITTEVAGQMEYAIRKNLSGSAGPAVLQAVIPALFARAREKRIQTDDDNASVSSVEEVQRFPADESMSSEDRGFIDNFFDSRQKLASAGAGSKRGGGYDPYGVSFDMSYGDIGMSGAIAAPAAPAAPATVEAEPETGPTLEEGQTLLTGHFRSPLSAFGLAAVTGDATAIKEILRKNPDFQPNEIILNGNTALLLAASKGHREVVEALMNDRRTEWGANPLGETPLHAAAAGGHTEIVRFFLGRTGYDVNAEMEGGLTALSTAAWHGRAETVAALMAADDIAWSADEKGNTPLHIAAGRGDTEIVKIFVDLAGRKSIDMNARNADGHTPLGSAVAARRAEVVAILAAIPGVDVNAADRSGNTPLHLAAQRGSAKIVDTLLRRPDLKRDATNNANETPLRLAELKFAGRIMIKLNEAEKEAQKAAKTAGAS